MSEVPLYTLNATTAGSVDARGRYALTAALLDPEIHPPNATPWTDLERIWHTQDRQGQMLAVSFR